MEDSKTADALRVVLADTFVMYFRSHAHHWNVKGMYFASLHEFLKKLYEDLFDEVDRTAEQIRSLDEMAPSSLAAIVAPSTINYTDNAVPDAREMIAELVGQNQQLLESLYKAHNAAEEENHDGVLNFIEDRIDKHAKLAWMLRSHLVGE